jgi:hypothetical protein
VAVEQRVQIPVALAEAFDDVVEGGGDVDVGQTEDVDDRARRPALALAGEGVTGNEQLADHVRRVGHEADRTPRGQRRDHATAARV